MTKTTHEALDREEGRLLHLIAQTARHGGPATYRAMLALKMREWEDIDRRRKELILAAQK